MSQLPVDVIVAIFSRLPVKTILRFRCVSKQFLSIIDGQYLLKRHLQYQSLRQKIIFRDIWSELFYLDLNSVGSACKLELPFENWNAFHIIGSCDGMLALTNFSDYSIGIWNISTRRHHILPHCLSKYKHCFQDYYNCSVVDGFGRDPNSNDYKIIRIVQVQLPNVTEVNVYSLEANCWKVIDCLPPYPAYLLLSDAAPVEGTLNWLGLSMDDNVRKYFILSYDLENEKQSIVLLPDSLQNDRGRNLIVLGGRLCLVFVDRKSCSVDIWVMKEYGLWDSWVKIHSFSAKGPISNKMLGFSNMGDQIIGVIGVGNDSKLFCFDLKSGRYEIKSGWLQPIYIYTVTAYVESLVSPPKVNN